MGTITPGFDLFEMQSPYLELTAALIGLFIGSFLNVLALRSLSGESILRPFSSCPQCKHRLGILELIPIVSYFCLRGHCRHCKEKISWHYPVVEAATAGLFAAVVHHFSQSVYDAVPERALTTIAMLIFTSVLIAVTITDFKEKLIPHEITYPSIICGLIFSFTVRHDLVGAMAGVGASYILFDFIAFYGLKYYYAVHPELSEDGVAPESEAAASGTKATSQETKATTPESKATAPAAKATAPATKATPPETKATTPQSKATISESGAAASEETSIDESDEQIDETFGIMAQPVKSSDAAGTSTEDDEPFEVMGGGDAVLSALLAAWLGWEKLVVALVIGFLIGAIMGAGYLIHDLIQQKRLGQVLKPAMMGFGIGAGGFATVAFVLSAATGMHETMGNPTVWLLGLIIALAGTVIGVIWSGNSVSKPFPFGPALAIGGIYAVFMTSLIDHTFIK